MSEVTRYSVKIKGDRGNYYWAVRFDMTDGGYLGITQYDENGELKDRVLLSPKQFAAIRALKEKI